MDPPPTATRPLSRRLLAVAGIARTIGIRPVPERGVEAARRDLRRMRVLLGRGRARGAIGERIEGGVAFRVHRPPAGREPVPALLYFHGGGWVAGSPEAVDGIASALASEAGCLVLCPRYRLAPEHPFPAAVDDAAQAWRALVEGAARLGADPARLAVGGESAGATLATIVAGQAVRRGAVTPCVQLLVYPATDASRTWPSHRIAVPPPLFDGAALRWCYDHYLPVEADRSDPRASPLRADDLGGLPPAHLVVAGHDPLRDEGLAYASALRDAGVEVTVRDHPELAHGFLAWPALLPAARRARGDLADVLRRAWHG